jgi:pimeloyl-ACP methyl ester carboxylesterase
MSTRRDPLSGPLPPRCPLLYLPGIDGTGRLLHRQDGLHRRFDVTCAAYPQDDAHSYRDLVEIGRRHLEQSGPAVVLAESFGGAVALMLALERSDLVRRLVLVNTFAYYPRRLSIDALGLIGPWLPNRPTPAFTRPLRSYFFFGAEVPEAERNDWWERTADVPLLAYGHRFRLLRDLDLRARLSEIAVPAIVFVSPNDWVVPPAAGRLIAGRLPNARTISIPAGHAALVDPRVDVASWFQQGAGLE